MAEGDFCERFLNLVARRGIDFWSVRRIGEGALSMKVSARHFSRLRSVARDSSCSVHIDKKYGLPFFLFRYRKRKGLLAGFLLFSVLLWFFSGFIWSINLVNETKIPDEDILRGLSRYGLYEGAKIKDIDIYFVRDSMMLDDERIAWVGVNLFGTGAVVEVKERAPIPEIVNKDAPCNIVASTSGQVLRMEAKAGEAVVETGEAVLSGQLLISGVIDSSKEGARTVRAIGEVWAMTWHKIKVEVPYSEHILVKTGRIKEAYTLRLFNLFINLPPNSGSPYKIYDRISEEQPFSLFGRRLPGALIADSFIEQSEMVLDITPEEAESRAVALCDEILTQDFPGAHILSVEREISRGADRVTVTAKYECEENIAKEEPIIREAAKMAGAVEMFS